MPIIGVSGRTERERRGGGSDAGMDGYLRKPADARRAATQRWRRSRSLKPETMTAWSKSAPVDRAHAAAVSSHMPARPHARAVGAPPPDAGRYITAKPDERGRAFGNDVARKIFSNAYTPVRQQAVLRSQKSIPGFDCPADPQIALAEVIPYPVKQGAVSWIERYVRRLHAAHHAQLPAGARRRAAARHRPAAWQHQHRPAAAARRAARAATRRSAPWPPKDCDKARVTDTRLTSKIERGAPWTERWVFDLCGTKAEVEMTFTPSATSGTSWTRPDQMAPEFSGAPTRLRRV